jgi:hypothetical protein
MINRNKTVAVKGFLTAVSAVSLSQAYAQVQVSQPMSVTEISNRTAYKPFKANAHLPMIPVYENTLSMWGAWNETPDMNIAFTPTFDDSASFVILPANTLSRQIDPFNMKVITDSLNVIPVQAVALIHGERTAVRGQTASFQTYINYPSFVERGEIRILAANQSSASVPLAIIPVDASGVAHWPIPGDVPDALSFVYRVYDKDNRFDETRLHELIMLNERVADVPAHMMPVFGTMDEAVKRTINLNGASVTVTGTAAIGDTVRISGQDVPVDNDGKFAARQIVPRDKASVDVIIERSGTVVAQSTHSFAVPKKDWFLVGQGDLTVGKNYGSGNDPARGDYNIGRAAFYSKGVVGNDIKVTASLDTGEARVKDLFSNLDRKDPRQLLSRLDNDQYYPTYGDDSTLEEDAPTQGRFYLRVQKDDSRLVIGNFSTSINGAELAQLDRGLFGALVDLNSKDVTSFGERKAQVIAFASDPGTIPGRDEFRGTGGSLYFLKRQDVSVGSEHVRVEVRDRDTGVVLENRTLHAQQDYDFDAFQGRITLLKPLASIVATSETVRNGSASGNVPVLVVRYEYTPTIGDLKGYTVGGRATAWVGDKIRVGATAQRDTVDAANQSLLGADVMLRQTAGTYIKAEVAQTNGPGYGQSNSVDGGLKFTDLAAPGVRGNKAEAYRGEIAVNFGELADKAGDHGSASAYFETLGAGFGSAGRLSGSKTQRWGAAADMPLGESTHIAAKYSVLETATIAKSQSGTVDLSQTLGGGVKAKIGLRYDKRVAGQLYNSTESGKRLDAAAQIGYDSLTGNWSGYAFGQATIDRDAGRGKNNRAGVGGRIELSEHAGFHAEISSGSGGLGADVQLTHRLSDASEIYAGYSLHADGASNLANVPGGSTGDALTLGARTRFSDTLSVNAEQRLGFGSQAPSLTRSFGLRYDPTSHVSFNGSFENGRIDDATTGVFRRTAGSIGVGYTEDDIRASASVEVRDEKGAGRAQTVWLFRNSVSYALNPDWRAIGRFNLAIANQDGPNVRAADFVEGGLGLAYRPVDNDRLNALLRYTYFQDIGPVVQISGAGTVQNPKQLSQIFSVDVNYDLTKNLTLGAKYGYRGGRVSLGRDSDVYVSSTAHLGVLRADYKIARQWDVLAEGRILAVPTAHDSLLGGLGAVYRHLNDNVKIGIGYSLSDFSDDLTDQSYSSHGPFMNLIGKF